MCVQVCWGIIYMQWNVPFQWVVLWVLTNKTSMEPQSKYRTQPSPQKMFWRRFSKRWLESLDKHSVTQQALATAAVTLMGWSVVLLFALSARVAPWDPFPVTPLQLGSRRPIGKFPALCSSEKQPLKLLLPLTFSSCGFLSLCRTGHLYFKYSTFIVVLLV